MGLTAGPVPGRVDAGTKQGLLDLVDHAVEAGWSARRACRLLEVNDRRVAGWRDRLAAGGSLADARPGPTEALHGLLDWEVEAIIDLYDDWAEVDGSHRKLAHRGSRVGLVHVSESTVYRVLRDQKLVIPDDRTRTPRPKKPWPEWVAYRPLQVWGHDFSAFMAARVDALVLADLVSRKWIDTLLVPHGRGTSEHVQAIYTRGLDAEGLLEDIEARMIAPNTDDQLPVLLAVSDNGPQMISGTTREFMALHALATHYGRPGVPTDQALIESFIGHVKAQWPHLERITDPGVLAAELELVRHEFNTVRLHAGLGYVTPDDEHEGRGPAIRQARREGLDRARRDRIAYRRNITRNRT